MVKNFVLLFKYYLKNLLFVFAITVITTCSRKNADEIAAIIGGKNIYISTLDSSLSNQVYQLRMNILYSLISSEIIMNEAKERHLTFDDLVNHEIFNKAKNITETDINLYIQSLNNQSHNQNNNLSNTSINKTDIYNYLQFSNRKKRQSKYIDSLYEKYNVQIILKPPINKLLFLDNLYTHFKGISNKNELFIISNFECSACQNIHNQLQEIIKKYDNNIKVYSVYYNDYISKSAIACEAASLQGKYWEMYDKLYDYSYNLDDTIFIHLAKILYLDVKKFKKDLEDKKIYKKLEKNFEILSDNNIYSTPTFIFNGQVYSDIKLDELDKIINNELRNNSIF